MNKFIIDPAVADFDDILQELDDYIESTPEGLRWKDTFNNSAGNIIKEIVAGNALFKRTEAIYARREAYLMSAKNRSSNIGIAQYKGYSVFRGTNARLQTTMVPNFSGTLSKFSVIGRVLDVDLVLLEDTSFVSGQSQNIMMTVGDVKEETLTIPSSRPGAFRFTRNIVSSDIDLFLNNVRVEISSRMIDADSGKFVCITNPFGSVDVFYPNKPEFDVVYSANDQLKLVYVNLDDKNFQLSDVSLDIGEIIDIEFAANFQDEEEIDSIKVNAPIYSETQYVVRAREDYIKIFELLETGITSTNYVNISPMIVRLFYVRDDGLLYTQAEKDSLIERLSVNRNMGLEPPEIGDAVRSKISLIISIVQTVIGSVMPQDVNAIIDAYQKKLGITIKFDDIEEQIENLTGVKIARITIGSTTWQINGKYEPEQHVSPVIPNGFIYHVRDVLRFSNITEPIWPTVVGDTIVDKDIIWRCKYLERQCDPLNPLLPIIPPRATWQAGAPYVLGQVVIPTTLDIFEYEVVGFVNLSGAAEPTWPPLDGEQPETIVGQEVIDERLVWRVVEQVGTPPAWTPSTSYQIGDVVLAVDPSPTGSDTLGLMFQLVSVLGVASNTEPTWPTTVDQVVVDGSIRWECRRADVSPKPLTKDRYCVIQRTIVLS